MVRIVYDAPMDEVLPRLQRLRELKALKRSTRPKLLAVYRNDPVAFVADNVEGCTLTPYQAEILSELPTQGRVTVRGPHGLGKTTMESLALLWFATTRDDAGDDWKAPATASAWHQLTHYLWPEVHKWARKMRWDKLGRGPFDLRSELLTLTLKLDYGEAFSASPTDEAKIEGAHGDSLLYVFDEAKAIPADTFDAAEGAFAGAGTDTTAEALALAASTPGEPIGRFYDIHARKVGTEDWWVRHVTLGEAINAGRVSKQWAAQRSRQWGAGSALYLNRVEGEFASSDEDGVIPLGWVEAAVDRWRARFGPHGERWEPPGDMTALGVDVARGGADRTVFARRYGGVVAPLDYKPYSTVTTETSGAALGILRVNSGRAVVDVVGVGGGVVDQLREALPSDRVMAFGAGEATTRRDVSGELGFADKRSAAWWYLRERLDPESSDEPLLLPPDDVLTGDLVAPKWKVLQRGVIKVEAKEDIKKRLKRSTDAGDGVVQSFWPGLGLPSSFAPLDVGQTNPWGSEMAG